LLVEQPFVAFELLYGSDVLGYLKRSQIGSLVIAYHEIPDMGEDLPKMDMEFGHIPLA
jgi:hypothetical protein